MTFLLAQPRNAYGRSQRLRYLSIAISAGVCLFAVDVARAQLPTTNVAQSSTLTLSRAIRQATANSPKVRAADFGIEAAAGTQRQAALLPNPEATIGVENFGGIKSLNGVAVTETTVGVSQLIEMGGKRDARRAVAGAGLQTAETDMRVAHLDLIRDVTVGFANALAAQQSLQIAKELETAAKEVLGDVTRRVKAARDPLFQRSKAEVAYASSTVARLTAESALSAALLRLGRFWSAPTVREPLSEDGYRPVSAPLPLASYEDRLKLAPDLERFRKVLMTREAELRLSEANGVPDVRANAGLRHFGGTNAVAFVAGLSIPIPILNQNQGEVSRAGAELKRAAQDIRQAEFERTQQLISAWSQWQSSWTEANSIRDKALPEAEKAFSLVLDGYHRGAFAYLEVLDAQRTRFDQRTKYIDALARLRTARAETERLAPATDSSGTP
jgi:cobalt-zinc-cadmium efflux system outer membrane protein